MGVWGAAQAIAFGLGGLIGAVGVDIARTVLAHDGSAFQLIFAIEASLFVLASALAWRATAAGAAVPSAKPDVPGASRTTRSGTEPEREIFA